MKKVLICLMTLMASLYSWGTVSYRWENSYTKLIIYKGDSNNGVTKDYASNVTSGGWFDHKSTVTTIVIEDGVITIGEYAFRGFDAVTSITIPTSLTTFKTGAFDNCEHITTIKYAGSPNQWANIDFANQTANPIGKSTGSTPTEVKNNRGFCFYGSNTKTRKLVITQGLDSIKQFAFINARYFTSAYIPSSVQKIKRSALICDFDTVVVNRTDRPRLANSTTISFNNPSKLIVPTGAFTNYSPVARWWAYSSTNNNKGAGTIVEKNVSGTVDGQSWSLGTNGVLTISGSGALTSSFVVTEGNTNQYPYYHFRYLVDKVVITGGITGLSNILQRAQAMRTLEFQQNNIPTKTATIPTDYIYADGTLKMLFPYTAVENVDPEAWSGYKRQLSNTAVLGDSEDQTSLLEALHDNLTESFDLQINRSLNNTIYNTFCSPVAISAERMAEIWGEGTGLYEMSTSAGSGEENEVVMNFDDATEGIAAGVPYLIKPTNSNVTSFTIEGIAPSSVVSEPEEVSNTEITFHGTLAPREVTEDEITNKSFIILTGTVTEDGQLLTYANEGTLCGMRAYWIMDTPAGAPMRRPVLRIGQSTTAIETVSDEQLALSGKKIMRNGQLFIVRGEKMYNMQGQLIK